MSFRKDDYRKIEQDDTEDHESHQLRTQQISRLRTILFMSLLTVIVIAATVIFKGHRRRQSNHPLHCGSTITEARQRGCFYEHMQRAWIPSECYFVEPSAEYRPFDDRTWYLDANLTTPADPELLKQGDVPLAWVPNFHQEHCTYNWRKLAIAVERRLKYVDSRVASLSHATHCALGLAEQTKSMACSATDDDEVDVRNATKSNINFLTCVPLFLS
jgi:hypothetical protein